MGALPMTTTAPSIPPRHSSTAAADRVLPISCGPCGDLIHLIIAEDAGVVCQKMPEGLRRRVLGDLTFLINYGAQEAQLDGVSVAAAGVVVLRDSVEIARSSVG